MYSERERKYNIFSRIAKTGSRMKMIFDRCSFTLSKRRSGFAFSFPRSNFPSAPNSSSASVESLMERRMSDREDRTDHSFEVSGTTAVVVSLWSIEEAIDRFSESSRNEPVRKNRKLMIKYILNGERYCLRLPERYASVNEPGSKSNGRRLLSNRLSNDGRISMNSDASSLTGTLRSTSFCPQDEQNCPDSNVPQLRQYVCVSSIRRVVANVERKRISCTKKTLHLFHRHS